MADIHSILLRISLPWRQLLVHVLTLILRGRSQWRKGHVLTLQLHFLSHIRPERDRYNRASLAPHSSVDGFIHFGGVPPDDLVDFNWEKVVVNYRPRYFRHM